MKKYILTLFFASGWILFALFILSGYFFNRLSNEPKSSFFTPIRWENHLQIFDGAIQCSLVDEDLLERKNFLKEKIFSKAINKEITSTGLLYYFRDDPIVLGFILEFIEKEKACCPFVKFDLSILPFKQGMAIRISGSKEAIEFLKDFENSSF